MVGGEKRLEPGHVADPALNLRVAPCGGFGVEAVLDIFQLARGCGEKFVFAHGGEIDLAVFTVKPVAPYDRNLSARRIASANLEHQGHALLDPAPTLLRGLAGALIKQHADWLAQCGLLGQHGAQFLAIGQQRRVALVIAQHRQDHDLLRSNCRRHAQAVVIAVSHDHPADQPGRDAPAGGVAQRLLALAVLIADPGGLGESGAEVVRGAGLQCLAVLHHRFDRIGRGGAGKALVLRLFAREHRHRQVFFRMGAVHFERAQSLSHRVGLVGVGGMALLPQELAGPQKHPRAHFPAHHIGPLVGQQRQIAPRLDPARHRLADHRF